MKRISATTGSDYQGNYDPDGYDRLSFSAAVPAFMDGTDSPRAYLERCLETLHAREPNVRAFAFVNEEGARRAADESTARYKAGRPLSLVDGCPMGLKDTLETIDMPMQQNSPLFQGWTANRDAACVWALRRQGAVMLGKTQVPEFAMGKSPPTRNPFDLRRTAGGSSSGSGASVGARMVPVSIGNQTMGSLIRPASFNANYGYKPSWGALNIGGMHPIAPSQDHIGPMAGTLADMWLVAERISAVAGGHNGHPGLAGGPALPAASKPARLAVLKTRGWEQIDEATRDAFETFLRQLGDAGVDLADQSTAPMIADLEAMLRDSDDISTDIVMYEVRWPVLAYIEAHGRAMVGDAVYARAKRGEEMTPDDYRSAIERRAAIRRKVVEIAETADGFVTLASSGPAPVDRPDLGGGAGDTPNAHLETGSRSFLSPWSMIGGPSLALPWLAVDGMPLGVQLMGAPDTDLPLVGIARWIDEALT